MKKILILFLILILKISAVPAFSKDQNTQSLVNEYCYKGDKILNYYEKLQNKENADKYIKAAKYFYYQASRLDLSNPNAFIGRARIALYQGNIKDAKNNLMMALNFNETNPKVNYYLGETFFADGEYTQAIDFYHQAYFHGYRYDFNTNLKLGICYEKLDDEKHARYHYKNAVSINPGSEEAIARLGGLDAIKINQNTGEEQNIENKKNDEYVITPEDLNKLNMPSL